MSDENSYQGVIVIVDDTPHNLGVLFDFLTDSGFKVLVAQDGESAIQKVEYAKPDLILLDVMMPGIDGFETCRRLKANPSTQDIPIIFLSALSETVDKVKGFELGAVDFITKPVQQEEVKARVITHLTLRNLQKRLEAQNLQLQGEIQERNRIEKSLRQAEEKYRSIFENATEGIFQATLEGQYITANPALARILGYDSPEELMAQIANIGQQLYVKPQRSEELAALMKRYDKVSDVQSQVYRKDGSVIWIAENIDIVKDEKGNLLYYEGTVADITHRKKTETDLTLARKRAELLLLNILPQPVAELLKRGQQTIAESFEAVTILFGDLVDFTKFSTQTSPTELVGILNQIFSKFDRLAEEHGIEKIKTIGDAYMVVAGLPKSRLDHAEAIAQMALDMQAAINQFNAETGRNFKLRIGINSGPVVAGVIGIKKFSYDLWGDTVNTASRMESHGLPGYIQVTDVTYELLRDRFRFQRRGSIQIKGKGEMITYWLEGAKVASDS
ncbi:MULTISPECIES: adenylate/guanylate cyclase domain-containing protein [unclassified Coleofasciculus]|uniref:adenylate/guanylate cyclase domain-containing protein n=1 Tax=unclassified Coleofasciculus TaxID=2692782 RepID=UPI0018800F99|nr:MULTISPECIES: adenylate/guanylate cyclase domain-containing protein [unclassified Coleofasciculus]MBE9127611.1 response regulator [Coleofasciculus sp. LEGE 07081]MBE9149658.1 response regulator [Coleofasciculus sp. LEGE 07092]